MLSNISRPAIQSNIISLCKLRRKEMNVSDGFTCLDIDKDRFNDIIMTSIGTESTLINYYLITPSLFDQVNATIVENFTSANQYLDVGE